MKARIYKPSKTTTQSGHGKTGQWVLEYEPTTPRQPESLMGWTASGDTTNQVCLRFETAEEAIKFAEKKGMPFILTQPHSRRIKPRNYSDNFRYIPEEKDGRRS